MTLYAGHLEIVDNQQEDHQDEKGLSPIAQRPLSGKVKVGQCLLLDGKVIHRFRHVLRALSSCVLGDLFLEELVGLFDAVLEVAHLDIGRGLLLLEPDVLFLAPVGIFGPKLLAGFDGA